MKFNAIARCISKFYNQDNFWQMFVYIILLLADHGPLQKNFTKILGRNGRK